MNFKNCKECGTFFASDNQACPKCTPKAGNNIYSANPFFGETTLDYLGNNSNNNNNNSNNNNNNNNNTEV